MPEHLDDELASPTQFVLGIRSRARSARSLLCEARVTQPYRVIEPVIRPADRDGPDLPDEALQREEVANALQWILAAARIKVAFAPGANTSLLALGCRLERRGVRRVPIETWSQPRS